jgi:GAF domain-containing protein
MHSRDWQASSNKNCVQPSRRLLLTLGLNQPLEDNKSEPLRIVNVQNIEDAVRVLTEEDVAALLLGPRIAQPEALDALMRSHTEHPKNALPTTIVLGADHDSDVLQKYVDAGQVFYLTRGEIDQENLRHLIVCGVQHFALRADQSHDPLAAGAESADSLLDLCARLPMQTDLASAGRLMIETGRDILRATIVQCFVYDPDVETITPADASESEKWTYSAASGLVAFVARTGKRVCVDRVGLDPRYDPDIDAPVEMSNARFLAEPILGPGGLPAGVLTAARSGEHAAFSDEEIRLIELLAECSAPTFNQILLQNRVQSLLMKRATGAEANNAIFRQEALEYHLGSWDQQGDVLKVLPPWLRRAFWIVLALFSASAVGLSFLLHGLRNIFGKVN